MKKLIELSLFLILFASCPTEATSLEAIKNPAAEASGEEIYAEVVTVDDLVSEICLEETGERERCEVSLDIHYPQLRGMKDERIQQAINSEFQSSAGATSSDLREWKQEPDGSLFHDFRVQYLDENYISIFSYGLYQPAGGAVAPIFLGGLNFSRKTGRRLNKGDLLASSIDEMKTLVKTRLRDNGGNCSDDSCVTNDTPFVFDGDNFYFLFSQYTLTGMGPAVVIVPIRELDPLPVFPEGPGLEQPPLPSGREFEDSSIAFVD